LFGDPVYILVLLPLLQGMIVYIRLSPWKNSLLVRVARLGLPFSSIRGYTGSYAYVHDKRASWCVLKTLHRYCGISLYVVSRCYLCTYIIHKDINLSKILEDYWRALRGLCDNYVLLGILGCVSMSTFQLFFLQFSWFFLCGETWEYL